MSADQYSERTLGKKLEWGALIGDHHHQHAGGRLDGRTFQLEAGASLLETEFGSPDGGMAAPCTAADGAAPAHQRTSPAVAVDTPPSSAHANSCYQRLRQRQLGGPAVSPAPSDASNINKKGIVPRQSSSAGLSVGKGVIEWMAGRGGRGGTAGVSLTVRATGTKDRHSKVKTAKGLRDRRVRLSAPTAIQFFDVQDRLGYDQPSKAVDWLIKKARPAIDELAPLEGVVVGDGGAAAAHRDAGKEMGESRDRTDLDDPSITVKEEEQRSSGGGVVGTLGGARAESRAKARERARERAKEKSICTGTETPTPTSVARAPTPPASATPAPPYPSSPLLPEILFLSQLRQHNSQPPLFDQHHHHLLRPLQPSDFSSSFAILQQPTSIATPTGNSATHLLPCQCRRMSWAMGRRRARAVTASRAAAFMARPTWRRQGYTRILAIHCAFTAWSWTRTRKPGCLLPPWQIFNKINMHHTCIHAYYKQQALHYGSHTPYETPFSAGHVHVIIHGTCPPIYACILPTPTKQHGGMMASTKKTYIKLQIN